MRTGHVHKRPKHKHCAISELKVRCAFILEHDFETPRTYQVIEKLLQIASPSYQKNPQLIFTIRMMTIQKTQLDPDLNKKKKHTHTINDLQEQEKNVNMNLTLQDVRDYC